MTDQSKWHDFFTNEIKFMLMLGTMIVGITMTYSNIDKQLALANQSITTLTTQFIEGKNDSKKEIDAIKNQVNLNTLQLNKLSSFYDKLQSQYDITIKQ